jgi:hypothetical protein
MNYSSRVSNDPAVLLRTFSFFHNVNALTRRGGIESAILAMAITHLQWRAAHLDLDGSAVTSACMCLRHDQDD